MAEVYRRASNGMKVTKVIALHKVTQWSLGVHRDVIAARARAILASHRHDGHAKIDTADGRVDKYVVLDDTRGLSAAMSIEFGRGPGTTNPRGEMNPVAPLRTAASIPVSGKSIGPRMKDGRFRKRKR